MIGLIRSGLARYGPARIALPALVVAAAFGLVGCGGSDAGTAAPQEDPPAAGIAEPSGDGGGLTDVTSVDDLRARFNADTGQPRLLLLLSPT